MKLPKIPLLVAIIICGLVTLVLSNPVPQDHSDHHHHDHGSTDNDDDDYYYYYEDSEPNPPKPVVAPEPTPDIPPVVPETLSEDEVTSEPLPENPPPPETIPEDVIVEEHDHSHAHEQESEELEVAGGPQNIPIDAAGLTVRTVEENQLGEELPHDATGLSPHEEGTLTSKDALDSDATMIQKDEKLPGEPQVSLQIEELPSDQTNKEDAADKISDDTPESPMRPDLPVVVPVVVVADEDAQEVMSENTSTKEISEESASFDISVAKDTEDSTKTKEAVPILSAPVLNVPVALDAGNEQLPMEASEAASLDELPIIPQVGLSDSSLDNDMDKISSDSVGHEGVEIIAVNNVPDITKGEPTEETVSDTEVGDKTELKAVPIGIVINESSTSPEVTEQVNIDLQALNVTKEKVPATTTVTLPPPPPPPPPPRPPHPPSPPTQTKTAANFSEDIKIDKDCLEIPKTGMCRGAFPMFYFDKNSLTCKQFVYGGCRGNKNIHKTAEHCYKKCFPEGLTKKTITGVSKDGSHKGHLTLHGGTGAGTLTFTGNDVGARVAPADLSGFTITGVYAIGLHFRTDKPHGLIAFLRQKQVPEELQNQRIQLYVFLRKGHLSVTHVFGDHIETFVMRKGGLQGGNWHSASITLDSSNGDLTLDVDGFQEYFTVGALGLHPHYSEGGYTQENFESVLWVGGVLESEVIRDDVVIGFVPFHGCIQHLSVSSGPTSVEMMLVKPLVATHHASVTEHCTKNCHNRYKNLCSDRAHCVEHFDHSTCDCFNSGQDGQRCESPFLPVLSLNGDGYVVHRLYEWMDRVHSYTNRISIEFRTLYADSILFYASAEHPERQYIAASLTQRGSIYVEINLGGGAVSHEFGEKLTSEVWYTLTVIHQQEKISLYIDKTLQGTLTIPGNIRYFHLDPDFYVGNAPDLPRVCGLPLSTGSIPESENQTCSSAGYRYHYDKNTAACHRFNYTGCGGNANQFEDERSCMETCYVPGLHSLNTFMGCLKNVFFNDISIIRSLKEKNKATRYYGSTKEPILGTSCNDTKYLSVTFSTERAAMALVNPEPKNFQLTISFKPTQHKGVLASGRVKLIDYDSVGIWELRHDAHHLYFYIHDNLLNMKSDKKIKLRHWNYVEVEYKSGRLNMLVNNQKQGDAGPGKLHFSPKVTIGKNKLENFPGYIGCIRKLFIGGTKLDLRTVVGTPMANKDVTYDNCQVLSPCEGPLACDHGGKCSIDEEGEVQCDCTGTGYTGKKCHFSLYKKSCEQYRQIGLKQDGIYHIDVDGNGPFPPAYVKCSFSSLLGETYTTVENNLEEEYEVRRQGLSDFQMDVSYRDFTPEMLSELVRQSHSCSQEIVYKCRRAPLSLSSRTWFSSPAKEYMTNFGTRTPGICRCSELGSCDSPDVVCNCDKNDGRLRKDKGIITDPKQLPVTSMVFLQGEDQKEDTEAYLTLKPLKCIAQASKEYTVSFTEPPSYMEVPAWREGSLSFAFRASSEKAILVYQPAYHPKHATFMISLVGERELEFMYRYKNQVHHQVLLSLKPLNDGDWQHVLVDVHNHQLRFALNSQEKLIEVDPDAYLGVLDGSMFLGGIPQQFKEEENHIESLELDGLVGCVKSLTLNEEIIDMERLFRAASNGVSLGCMPACNPNPCQNGAQCIEMWGSYKCDCANPLAHSGKNCEIDINKDALTFKTEESKFKYFDNDSYHLGDNLFNETFYLNFRTHSDQGLLLFAYNYLHNFVQLYLASNNKVTFLFNHGREVKELSVTADDGVVFNTGQSVQVRVHRSNISTCLHVFTEGTLMKESLKVGPLLLQEDEYEQFPFGDSQPLPDMVYYPHSMTKPVPFFLAYLGGANDRQHDIRSDVPGIMGCIRGVKIGENVMHLKALLAESPFPAEDVSPDCQMACDENPCLNGGVCTEDFQFYNNFHCDCKGTSYTGATCSSEISYTFQGDQWIKQDSSSSPLDSDVTLELAFSTSTVTSVPQAVAFLRSTNPSSLHDYILVHIEADGSIIVEAELHSVDADQVHGAVVRPSSDGISAFDGLRHYIIIQKDEQGLSVKIDGGKREVVPLKNVYVSETPVKATPTSLYLGDIESAVDDRMSRYEGFRGCLSNVRLSTPEEVSYPLRQYSEGDLHLSKKGLPGQGRCASFSQDILSYPMLLARTSKLEADSVMGSEWVYARPEKVPFVASGAGPERPVRDTVFDNIVPAVAGVVLAVSLTVAALLLLREYMKQKKRREEEKEEEERKPLFNGPRAPTHDDERSNTVRIASDAQEMVPLKSAPDGIPQSSPTVPHDEKHLSNYVAAKETESMLEKPSTETQDIPEKDRASPEDEIKVGITDEIQIHSDVTHDVSKATESTLEKESPEKEDTAEVSAESQDGPKIIDYVEKTESPEAEAAIDVTEEVQVHAEAKEEEEEVQEDQVIGAASGEDTSSESSIECTIDINTTPPTSPTGSKPTQDINDDLVASSLRTNELHITEPGDVDDDDADDSDPEPVLKKYTLLSREAEETVGTSEAMQANSESEEKATAKQEPVEESAALESEPLAESAAVESVPLEGSEAVESKPADESAAVESKAVEVSAIVESKPEESTEPSDDAENDNLEKKAGSESEPEELKPEAGDSKSEEENEVKIDFSKVPVIKIEKTPSEGEIIDVEAEADPSSKVNEREPEPIPVTSDENVSDKEQSDESEVKGSDSKNPEEAGEPAATPESALSETDDKEQNEIAEPQSAASKSVEQEEKTDQKTQDTDDEFIDYRDDNIKVEAAQRMSKPI